jgi:pyruvate/2-oxoglutarate dehydrogenase complex dihydrolipoamide dehydrogenase (E3) component
MPDFDLLVIGAGAAGLSVAAGAAQLGVKTALVERDRMGGDCLNFGCVPSKALLAAAHTANAIRGARRFGLHVAIFDIDWDVVRSHVQSVVAAIAPNDSEARFAGLGVTVLRGEARFTGPDSITVDGRAITAKHFVIAAGSRPVVPPIPGLAEIPHWTNAELFNLPQKPTHLLILGGGPVGLEMADAFVSLGCAVTVIEAATIASRDDTELVEGLRLALTRRGVTFLEGVPVASAEPGPVLVLRDGRRVAGSHLLIAVGRQPNLEALNLEAAGIATTHLGITTDRGLRCWTNKRVYAVGDIADPIGIGPRAFTHVGLYHASIVIRRALFRLPAKLNYAALPRVTYTDPELAQTGMTEAEAKATGYRFRILRWPMSENDRAVAELDETGLVKLVVRGNRVVGAGILAPHAGEMIGQWTLAISRKIPLSALAGLIVPYPTRSEAGKRAAGSYYAAKLFSERTKAVVRFLGRLSRFENSRTL